MVPEGSGISVLYEDTEEFRGRLGEIFLEILLKIDDER